MPAAHKKESEPVRTLVDPIDLRILDLMRSNARVSLTDMSKKLGLSKSTVKYRVDRLIGQGVIKSLFALVNHAVYGMKLSVAFDLTTEPQLIGDVAERLASYPEVIRAYEMAEGPELHLHALFADLEQLEHFVRNKLYLIPGVKTVKSRVILKAYKTELTLTV